MGVPYVRVRRSLYEEPDCINLLVDASNGTFSGGTELYTNPHTLREIGEALQAIPWKYGAEFTRKCGPENERWYASMRVLVTAGRGNCAFAITFGDIKGAVDDASCQFSISCDLNDIHEFGRLLVEFAKLEHLDLLWVPNSEESEMFEEHQKWLD